MICPFCKETIIDGARVCKHCGRDQPLTAAENSAKRARRTPILILGGLLLIGIIMAFAGADYQRKQTACARVGLTGDTCIEAFDQGWVR